MYTCDMWTWRDDREERCFPQNMQPNDSPGLACRFNMCTWEYKQWLIPQLWRAGSICAPESTINNWFFSRVHKKKCNSSFIFHMGLPLRELIFQVWGGIYIFIWGKCIPLILPWDFLSDWVKRSCNVGSANPYNIQ